VIDTHALALFIVASVALIATPDPDMLLMTVSL
jgi:threonine/homoserine/homoserine lactone efflux protein